MINNQIAQLYLDQAGFFNQAKALVAYKLSLMPYLKSLFNFFEQWCSYGFPDTLMSQSMSDFYMDSKEEIVQIDEKSFSLMFLKIWTMLNYFIEITMDTKGEQKSEVMRVGETGKQINSSTIPTFFDANKTSSQVEMAKTSTHVEDLFVYIMALISLMTKKMKSSGVE